MKFNKSIAPVALALAALYAGQALAITDREQNEQAQHTYEASASDYNDAAAGFEKGKEIAETVVDWAVNTLIDLATE